MYFLSGSILVVIKQQMEFHILNHGGNHDHCISNQSETLEMDVAGYPAIAQIPRGKENMAILLLE